jgi:hypothetical protein
MKIFLYSIVACAALIFTFSCNKTSLVGSDLFIPDSVELLYEDGFDISAKTIRGDSVVTFDGESSFSTLMVGKIVDPIFGTTTAEAYTDLSLISTTNIDFKYTDNGEVKQAILDSVVLILGYQPISFYGDSTLAHTVEVRILDEDIFDVDSLFSTYQPEGEGRLIGTKTFVPNFSDSIRITEPGDETPTAYGNQLRMTLDKEWVQEMFDDTSLINTRENFNNYAPGLKITSSSSGSSTWGIAYGNSVNATVNAVKIYYTKDTIQSTYNIIVNGDGHIYYKNDYENSEIAAFFNDEEKGDSLLFMQGTTGAEIELDFPFLQNSEYNDYLVNQAELEFFVLEDATFGIHNAVESITMSKYDENGDLVILEDAFLEFGTDLLQEFKFDGTLASKEVDGMRVKKYSAFISIYTMERLASNSPYNRIKILPRNKSIIANRSIIYGPGHSKYPMKFKLNYSK